MIASTVIDVTLGRKNNVRKNIHAPQWTVDENRHEQRQDNIEWHVHQRVGDGVLERDVQYLVVCHVCEVLQADKHRRRQHVETW